MGTPSATKLIVSELSGDYKIIQVYFTPTAASDTVTLVAATHGISEIGAILGVDIQAGQDADFQTAYATFSGLVLTVVSLNAAGASSTNWDSAVIRLTLLAK